MLKFILTILIVLQIIQAWSVLQLQNIQTLDLPFDVRWQAIASILWVIIFLYGFVKLARTDGGTVRYVYWSLLIFTIYSIVRLILLTQAEYDRQRLGVVIIGGLLLISALSVSIYQQRHRSS